MYYYCDRLAFKKFFEKEILTMKNEKFKLSATDVILILLSAAYVILLFTAFTPCGPKDDGSFMKCQWAWRASVALAFNTAFINLFHLIISKKEVKIGLSIAALGISITSLLIPEKIIGLCMMDTMRCHTHTKGGIYVFSVLILITAVADIVLNILKTRKNK